MDNDRDFLSETAITELTQEVEVRHTDINKNGSYVRITEDNMEAWLYLTPPEQEQEDSYTLDEIYDFLQKNHIKKEYQQENLERLLAEKKYETEILAAQGKPIVEGSDGYYEYKFDPGQYKTPKILANGSVDYTSMSTLQNVREGDVVAIYHHAKSGDDGFDVTGKYLQAKSGKEIQPLRGQSVTTKENPDIYLASKSGKIELKNGRIDIQAVHEIHDDVTLITGRVEFFGDVIIYGNVEAGVVIRAGRNIEIKGTVEAVNLFAGGDIVLTRGIQGAQKAKVSARGNMFADFIEHTIVTVGGNVQANIILNSRIEAEGKVTLTGKRGTLIGGYTHGVLGIAATEIGNVAEIRTIVHAGCKKEDFFKAQDAKLKEIELRKELKEQVIELGELLKKKKLNDGRLTIFLEKRLVKLEESIVQGKAELTEKMKERQEFDTRNAKGEFAEIIVQGNIYKGAVVSIAQMQMPIEHTTCYMRYYQQRGIIESSVIAYT